MRTTVVVGGTAGLGAGIAKARFDAGDQVTVVGRNRDRGEKFVSASGDRATFVQGDISTTAGTWDITDTLLTRHDTIDTLVLTAYAPQMRRRVNADRVEMSLAQYYVARRILGDGLAEAMLRAEQPLVVSLNGIGVVRGQIHWDDLMLEHGWNAIEATKQGGRAAELLGVMQAHERPQVPYLLFHPGYTRTSATGLPPALRAVAGAVGTIFGQPVSRAIVPILALLQDPPTVPLTGIDRDRNVPLETFADLGAAMRLHEVMADVATRP